MASSTFPSPISRTSQAGRILSADRLRAAAAYANDAAIDPSRWPDALERIADAAGARGAMIFSPSLADAGYFTLSLEKAHERYVVEQWRKRNPRSHALGRVGVRRFVGDSEIVSTPQAIENDPYYRDLLESQGFRFCARTILHSMPHTEQVVLSIERDRHADHYDPRDLELLDGVRSDLTAAVRLAELAGFRTLDALASGWDLMDRPCVLLRSDARVLRATEAFSAVPADILSLDRFRLKAANPADNRRLADRIAAVSGRVPPAQASAEGPIVLNRRDGAPALVVELIPLANRVSELFSGASVMAVVTDIRRPLKVPGATLSSVFKLTPSEARIVARLVAGDSVADTADSLKLSRETIRTQLKSAFSKCGVSRQSELILLATRMAG